MEAGIDEAGRGPVLGPLVVAGVATPDPQALFDMGCRDSKTVPAPRRERLARLLHDHPDVHVEVRTIAPAQLDAEMPRGLNHIELLRFQDLARALAARGARRIVADAADVDAARFGRRLATAVPGVEVLSQHKADATWPCVAAASIVAKVARDAAIAELGRRLERRLEMPMGSGYPSDPATRAFLAAWVQRFHDLPEGARRTWRPARDLMAPRAARLEEFP